ncbi:ArnT family glycosyltransferase [Nitrosophilus kaiyonis]|uniref:ArnT family glycosyltransferase n=1 Tax=Nitrosophilus kaiyonis TaxID=2930200 RepID=UPI0024923C05|nr:glycosyltransferase family 39 protein [Nitrosophilus kaiyonis]
MQNSYFKNYIILLLIITAYRFFVLLNTNIDLYMDEAYYWFWSKNLDFGYYSKPPMIAWTIALFTSIFGDCEICIKLPALLLYPITSIIIFLIAKELFDEKIAFWSAFAFITLPAVSMSSLIISTDVVLLFFWSLTLYLFIKAIKTNKDFYWILAGFSAGFGLLSKYTMIIFVISVFLYLFISKEHKKHLKNIKLYLTMLLAALVYMPNLIWNYHHKFISFMHTKEISEIDRDLFHLNKMLEFLGAQFGVFGPIFFAVLIFLIFKPFIKEDRFKLLYSFTLPFLAIITLQSFLARAFANWAAPTYVAATILVVSYLIIKNRKKLLAIGIVINILLALILYHYQAIANILNIELTSKTDPYKRVLGWEEVAKKIEPIIKNYPNVKLLFDDRKLMSEMIFYLKPHPFDAVMYNPKHLLRNQFDLVTDLQKHIGEDFIFITKRAQIKDVTKRFESYKKIATIKVTLYKDFSRVYHIYYLKRFKGY